MVLGKIPNIQVIKLMQSLKTREFVKETFNWQIYYWTITEKGVTYLREYLHLGETVVPMTWKPPRQSFEKPDERRREGGIRRREGGFGREGGFRRRTGGFGREGGYRRDGEGFKKDSGDFRPQYVCNDYRFQNKI